MVNNTIFVCFLRRRLNLFPRMPGIHGSPLVLALWDYRCESLHWACLSPLKNPSPLFGRAVQPGSLGFLTGFGACTLSWGLWRQSTVLQCITPVAQSSPWEPRGLNLAEGWSPASLVLRINRSKPACLELFHGTSWFPGLLEKLMFFTLWSLTSYPPSSSKIPGGSALYSSTKADPSLRCSHILHMFMVSPSRADATHLFLMIRIPPNPSILSLLPNTSDSACFLLHKAYLFKACFTSLITWGES